MDTAGAFIGVIIAAVALWFLEGRNIELGYRLVFGLAALLAFCSFIVTFFVDETKVTASAAFQSQEDSAKSQPLRATLQGLGREYWLIWVGSLSALVAILVVVFSGRFKAQK